MDLLIDTADDEIKGDLVYCNFDHIADFGVQALGLRIIEHDLVSCLRTMPFDEVVVFQDVRVLIDFEFDRDVFVEVGDLRSGDSVEELHVVEVFVVFIFFVKSTGVFAFDPEFADFEADHADKRIGVLAEVLVEHEAQACGGGEAGNDDQDEEALLLLAEDAFAGQIDGERQGALLDRKVILLEVVVGDAAADRFEQAGLLVGAGRNERPNEYQEREDEHGQDHGREADAGEAAETHEAALDVAEKTAQEYTDDQGEGGGEKAEERLFKHTGHAEASGPISVCLQDADILHVHFQEVLDGEVHDDQDQADQ